MPQIDHALGNLVILSIYIIFIYMYLDISKVKNTDNANKEIYRLCHNERNILISSFNTIGW